MEEVYRANDGTIFEDEDECLKYEYELSSENANAIFADANGNIFTLRDVIKDTHLIDNIRFVFAINKETWWVAYDLIHMEYWESFPDWDGDFQGSRSWAWSDEKDEWISFEEYKEEMNKMINQYNNLKKVFEKMREKA